MDDRIRVRIDDEIKAAAMAKAKEQGITLSDAVRDLVILWCNDYVNLGEMENIHWPTADELRKLGAVIDKIKRAVEAGHNELYDFAQSYGHVLEMASVLEDDGWHELPAYLRWQGR